MTQQTVTTPTLEQAAQDALTDIGHAIDAKNHEIRELRQAVEDSCADIEALEEKLASLRDANERNISELAAARADAARLAEALYVLNLELNGLDIPDHINGNSTFSVSAATIRICKRALDAHNAR